ncbi:unnamed protein product [Urochloa humidicola]
MTTAETKLDQLLMEMKTIQTNQLKLTTSVDALTSRTDSADKIATDLSDEIKLLTSRIATLEASTASASKAPPREEEERARGHREEYSHQGADPRISLDPTLVKGEQQLSRSLKFIPEFTTSNVPKHMDMGRSHDYKDFKLPKLDFPKFSGDHPRVWRDKCEKYFTMYRVPVHNWVPFATINFRGNAELWLQSYEAQHTIDSWPDLCVAVEHKFGQDLYQSDMKELLAIKQTGSVLDYAEKFEKMRHKVLVYNKDMGEVFFVQNFLDGLNFSISDVIALHKLRTVDSALSLALMQEQVLDSSQRRYSGRSRDYSRNAAKLTHTEAPANSGILGATPATTGVSQDKSLQKPKWNDRVSNLRSLRKARGECMRCGEKYGPNHKCPTSIPLHVLDELFDVLQIEEEFDASPQDSGSASGTDDKVLTISFHATAGTVGQKTIRLNGLIDKQEVLMLIDSGSGGNFISQSMVDALKLPTQQIEPVQVTVANGAKFSCSAKVVNLSWWTQGHTFTADFRVIPLGCYDMILGMEWLEDHSPMWVHWKRKRLRFSYQGARITLRGVKENTKACGAISSKKLKGLLHKKGVAQLIQLCPLVDSASSPAIPVELQKLVDQHKDLFDEPKELLPHRAADHHIPLLPGTKPVNIKPYRYAPSQKDEIEHQIKEMLRNGVIRPSSSPFASPVLLVKKKDGSWRFCVDYRHLNASTVKNKFPLPIVDELLDELSGARWFTKLDLRAGYHQIRLVEADEHKTAFRTHAGHWEFRVMPFGLTNAPATFQALMNSIFALLLRKCVLVFMDDILIYSQSIEDHQQHLQQVFDILRANKLFLKQSKCSFGQNRLEYLGHIIGENGVATDPSKLETVRNWPVPQCSKDLRGFLGLSGYYRKFIQHYGLKSKILTDLLKKNVPFIWTSQHQTAFEELKQALISAPVLALPDFNKQFTVETDASAKGIGAVLTQQGHPIAYLSKALGPRAQALSTYDKECMAVILAVDKWKQYLQHREFIISTDHRSLTHLTEQRLQQGMQHKAFVKLLGLQYRVVYKKGPDNKAADALSRKPSTVVCAAVSMSKPRWLEIVTEGYEKDPTTKQLLSELSLTGSNDKGFSLSDGLIRFKGRIWLGTHKEAHDAVLLALHSSGLGGHSGIAATYHKIKEMFAWPGLKKDVQAYVNNCQVCQQAKTEHVKYPGTLQPLPVPNES